MPIDKLDGTFTVKTRDQVRDDFLRDYKFRVPDADTSKDSQPFVDGSVLADQLGPLYANAQLLADGTTYRTARGTMLTKHAAALGRPRRPATGASGYVVIEAATGGGSILAGTELKYSAKNVRFKVLRSGVYLPGQVCAVTGIDSGAATNLPSGTKLSWLTPPVGILGTCLVFKNGDGSGLTGGAPEETDEELVKALDERYANPASSGNEAEVIQYVQKIAGLAIEKAFVFPCMNGPGEYAVAFTMRPSEVGASRLPNGAHISQVEADLKSSFPGDDGIMVATVSDHAFQIALKVRWRDAADGWFDIAPWPAYASPKVVVMASPAPTALTCRVDKVVTAPTVGKNIAFYNATSKTFVVKRILTAVLFAGDEWDLTFDPASSDGGSGGFIPAAGAIVSPWSVSLTGLIVPLLTYVGKQGVGEMRAAVDLLDPGRRQRRQPEPAPETWPHAIANSITDDIFPLTADAVLSEPTTPFATTVGTPPLLVYLHKVSDIGIFQL